MAMVLAFATAMASDGHNRDCTSVGGEGEGGRSVATTCSLAKETRNTPLDDKSRESLAQLTAYWADAVITSVGTLPQDPV